MYGQKLYEWNEREQEGYANKYFDKNLPYR